VHHRITARAAHADTPSAVDRDPAVVAAFLSDAAHVPGGHAAAVSFPSTESQLAALVAGARHLLPVGAQSSLTGGATPRGDLIVSTRALNAVGPPRRDRLAVGAGVPLARLQQSLAAAGLYYPPVPTFDGAFVGGTIATNAAGAATFKYGSTRAWVEGLTVVLASGDILEIERGQVRASDQGRFTIDLAAGSIDVPVPSYSMPRVPKLSAGYYAAPGMDLVDLFVGSEGTLGIVAGATLRVIPRPRRYVALIRCRDDEEAIAMTATLRDAAARARRGDGPLDVAAIEYMDSRALACVPDDAFSRSGVTRPPPESVLLLLQIETPTDESMALDDLSRVLAATGVPDDPYLAGPDDVRGAQRLFDLREAVPASVNALVAAAKTRAHPDIHKTAGDMIVPFDRLHESIALYRRAFEERGLEYAIWGHVSDGNLHPNVVPRTLDDVRRGEEAIVEMAAAVIAMGGAPLAEHGVGRSALKQRLLRDMYGDEGIEQMRAVKRALDPEWKLASGVLFPP
jgi:D-lactate dehydrogenase (cytochrome)